MTGFDARKGVLPLLQLTWCYPMGCSGEVGCLPDHQACLNLSGRIMQWAQGLRRFTQMAKADNLASGIACLAVKRLHVGMRWALTVGPRSVRAFIRILLTSMDRRFILLLALRGLYFRRA